MRRGTERGEGGAAEGSLAQPQRCRGPTEGVAAPAMGGSPGRSQRCLAAGAAGKGGLLANSSAATESLLQTLQPDRRQEAASERSPERGELRRCGGAALASGLGARLPPCPRRAGERRPRALLPNTFASAGLCRPPPGDPGAGWRSLVCSPPCPVSREAFPSTV